MEAQRKQTIEILVDGKRKRLRGVTKYTTCDDVIKMVIKKTVQSSTETPVFEVFELFNGKEKTLTRKDRILKVLRSWGSESENIRICVRRIDDVRSKMATIKDKQKQTSRLRTNNFHNMTTQKPIFSSKVRVSSLDFTNTSDISKQCTKDVTNNDHSVLRKGKFSGVKRKYEPESKQSVFRRIFTTVLKKRKTFKDEMKRKAKLQKTVLTTSSDVKMEEKNFTYMDLQQSFKAQLDNLSKSQLVKLNTIAELNTAFVDEIDQMAVDLDDVSALNMCIMEDPNETCDNENDAYADNALDQAVSAAVIRENSNLIGEQTFVKLDRIKKLFEVANAELRSDDDFVDSFMRSKVYESESDGDY